MLRVTKVRRQHRRADLRHRADAGRGGVRAARAKRVAKRFEAENFTAAIRAIADRTKVEFGVWGDNPDGTMTRARGEAGGEEKVTFGAGLLFTAAVERIGGALRAVPQRVRPGHAADPRRHRAPGQAADPVPGGRAEAAHARLRAARVHRGRRAQDSRPVRGHRDQRRRRRRSAPGVDADAQGPARPEARRRRALRAAARRDEATTLGSVGAALLGSFAAPFAPSTGSWAPGRSCSTSARRGTRCRVRPGSSPSCRASRSPAQAPAWDTRCDASAAAPPSRPHLGGVARACPPPRRCAAPPARPPARSATLEVGEVRAAATNASGAVEPPAQTETVWEGLARPRRPRQRCPPPGGTPRAARAAARGHLPDAVRLGRLRAGPAPLPGHAGGAGYRNGEAGRPGRRRRALAVGPRAGVPAGRLVAVAAGRGGRATSRSSVADTAVPGRPRRQGRRTTSPTATATGSSSWAS